MTKARLEAEMLFKDVVYWASDATGGNAAFNPKYGEHTLNELRSLLGLPSMTEAELKEVLS